MIISFRKYIERIKKLEVWGIEPQASTMLKWRSPTELYSLPSNLLGTFIKYVFKLCLIYCTRYIFMERQYKSSVNVYQSSLIKNLNVRYNYLKPDFREPMFNEVGNNLSLFELLKKNLKKPFDSSKFNDATKFLIGVSNIIYASKNVEYEILRKTTFLSYLDDYLDYICWNKIDGNLNNKYLIVATLLGYLLRYRIFQPSEIVQNTNILPKFKHLILSADAEQQRAGVIVYSLMIQSGDVPQKVLKHFYPLAVTLDTSFQNIEPYFIQSGCIHFLGQLFMNISNIPYDKIFEITCVFKNVLTTKCYNSIYCDVIDSLKLELNCYPKTYSLLVEIHIIDIINLLLSSVDSKTRVAANMFFSLLFLNLPDEELPFILSKLKIYDIISGIDDLDENINISSIQLVTDISSRTPECIDLLLNGKNKLIPYILGDYDREFNIKLLIYHIFLNILIKGNSEQCVEYFMSLLFSIQLEEIISLDDEIIYNFLNNILIGFSKIFILENYNEIIHEIDNRSNIYNIVSGFLNHENQQINELSNIFLNKYFDIEKENKSQAFIPQ